MEYRELQAAPDFQAARRRSLEIKPGRNMNSAVASMTEKDGEFAANNRAKAADNGAEAAEQTGAQPSAGTTDAIETVIEQTSAQPSADTTGCHRTDKFRRGIPPSSLALPFNPMMIAVLVLTMIPRISPPSSLKMNR
ncbi:hypothetical protein [Paenibacillus stellifer]|uniref:hypothetical protein n=1 Tax=Paenibacillus stellifer TaxID=169760 RepID=UPI00146FD5D6|nr:hypothetical protein [Paenibacillus stellifer]